MRTDITEEKMSHPPRLAFKDQLCRPTLSLIGSLGTCETVDADTMFGDENKIVQVTANQFCFVLGPQCLLETCKSVPQCRIPRIF